MSLDAAHGHRLIRTEARRPTPPRTAPSSDTTKTSRSVATSTTASPTVRRRRSKASGDRSTRAASPHAVFSSTRTIGPARWTWTIVAGKPGRAARRRLDRDGVRPDVELAAALRRRPPGRHVDRHAADDDAPVLDLVVPDVDVAEEVEDERRRRVGVDLVRAADLLDLAVVHDHHAIGELERLVLIVRDEQAGDVQLVVQPPQPAPQLLAHLGVERPERLVEQQHARLDGERAGQRHALPLAARQLRRVALRQRVELHQRQQPLHRGADVLLGRPVAPRPDAQAEGDVLEHGQVPEQRVVLEDEADAPLADALVGGVVAVEMDRARSRSARGRR